jgi:hypothetical protein
MALPKVYFIQFGTGDARNFSGLSPTFLIFADSSGATFSPPTIKEINSSWGNYGFSFTFSSTLPIYFQADGATSGLSSSNRYVSGVLDPVQAVDQSINGIGNTLGLVAGYQFTLAISATNLQLGISSLLLSMGNTSSSFGSTSVDPGSVFGYLKRLQELQEGDQSFQAAGGTLSIYNRTAFAGSTTLLRTKTLLNLGQTVTKTGD